MPKKFILLVVIAILFIVLLSLLWPLLVFVTKKPGQAVPISLTDELASRLKDHVMMLSEEIGERSAFQTEKLEAASYYITSQFKAAGYDVEILPYTARGRNYENIQAVKNGSSEIIVIGAHYDTVTGSPGADDNAAGVAVMIEAARLVKGLNLNKTVRFVAFSTEEAFFKTGGMGSFVYASSSRAKDENIVGMISIEMVGYYSDEQGSQSYPLGYGLFYPSQGNFIAVVSDFGSRPLKDQVASALKSNTNLPVESAWGFRAVPGIDWSDQWSFWKHGYPAVMIADTGPYRNPNYHRKTDTFETLDYDKMAMLTMGLAGALRDLAG